MDQVANILTKPLPKMTLDKLIDKLGMVPGLWGGVKMDPWTQSWQP